MAEHGIKCSVLAQLIDEKKLSINSLAKETGISKSSISTYSSFMQEYADINSKNLITLAKYFNVSCDYLLGLTTVRNVDKEIFDTAELFAIEPSTVENIRQGAMDAHFTYDKAIDKLFSDTGKTIRFMHLVALYFSHCAELTTLLQDKTEVDYYRDSAFQNAYDDLLSKKDLTEFRLEKALKELLKIEYI